MTDKETQVSDGVASELNAELGLKVGDKCLVVFNPSHLNYIEDGNVIDCVLDAIEETKTTVIDGEKTFRKYRVSFGLQGTTVNEDFIFSLKQKDEAFTLAKYLLEKRITKIKEELSDLEKALLLVET